MEAWIDVGTRIQGRRGRRDVVGSLDSSALAFSAGGIGRGWTTDDGSTPSAPLAPALTATGVTQDRLQALALGASPRTAAERVVAQRLADALRGTVEAVHGLVAEGTRQAKLGRDINGRPLQTAEDSSYEARVLQLINVERARYGLGAVSYDRRLDAADESHNAQQAATGTMAHEGIGDADPAARIQATGFRQAWGENVAAGQRSPEQVVAEWMASPEHRRNILDPTYRLMGVSYTTAANGRTYWAQEFGA
jgi:uncharacterized protein YkwD